MKIASLIILAAFAKEIVSTTQLTDGRTVNFKPQSNYLSMELNFKPSDAVRREVEKDLGMKLKNRGEAHITVLTPPEYNILKDKISIQEINEIALKSHIQESLVKPICVGVGESKNNSALKTYYVVVLSQNLLNIRTIIANEYKTRGGDPEKFDANAFYPHITLGYTDRDLHLESDGVIKNTESCRYTIGL